LPDGSLMKYLQFTLRDFFWLTIVVGLTVGIVIERNQVRALRVYQQKAQWWEDKAKDFAKEVETRTGLKTQFLDEASSSQLGGMNFRTIPRDVIWSTTVPSWSTNDSSYSWPTGMKDLNIQLVAAPFWIVFFLFTTAPRNEQQRQQEALFNARIRPYLWIMVPIGLFNCVIIVAMYSLGLPFTATLVLFLNVNFIRILWQCSWAHAPAGPATA
jgi:hypothetical protein